MPQHRIQNDLETADFTSTVNAFVTPEGRLFGAGTTVGNGVENWAPGALFIDTDAAAGSQQWINEGTKTSASWARKEAGNISLVDDEYIDLGTGNDVRLKWNATYLEGGPATGLWATAPSEADPRWHQNAYCLFDDFLKMDPTATIGGWTEDVQGTGTQTLADEVAGGELLLTCQATTDDASEQATFVTAPFLLAAGKTLWYEARVKQTGDVQSEVSFGLVALGEDLTAVADVYPQDGICFAHQDASMALALTCSKNGTNTGAVAAVHTMVTGTYATYGLFIDGVTSVTPYINGVAGTAATATINNDESMAPYFLVRNGDATTQQILTVDYVKVVQLR